MNRRLKLVFWPVGENDTFPTGFRNEIIQVIRLILGEFNDLRLDGDLQELGEEDLEPMIECLLKIVVVPESNTDLLNLLRHLTNFLRAKALALADCSIVLVSKKFFDMVFCPAQVMVPLQGFAFNNIINRSQLVEHRRVAAMEDRKGLMARLYNTPLNNHGIFVDFEHDRRQLIVRFPYSERSNKIGALQDYIVALNMRYRSIRRVLFSIQQTTTNRTGEFDLTLHFHLSSPVVVRRIKVFSDKKGKEDTMKANLLNANGERFTAWDIGQKKLGDEISQSPYFKLQLLDITAEDCSTLLNRLSTTTDGQLEIRLLKDKPIDAPFYKLVATPFAEDNEYCREKLKNKFDLNYMLEAIFSRGTAVKDYLLLDEKERDKFINLVVEDYKKNRTVTLSVLESVLNEVDERLDGQHPARIFHRIYQRVKNDDNTMRQLHDANEKEGFVKVRKVVITPTRTLFVAPELLMGNRVLRIDPVNYPLERFLRVTFRDDDGQTAHESNVGQYLIDKFIRKKLLGGITIAGRHFNYFGSSNSQMRDNGCYFINATLPELESFRQQLGSFALQSAPKTMSRVGQCFTQARESNIVLDRSTYTTDFDIQGGKNSAGKPYTFSDGVGSISQKLATQLSKDLELEGCVPSCFQIRFRGHKGVLSKNQVLDVIREWAKKNGLSEEDKPKEKRWMDLGIKFRPSQHKFITRRDNQKLEVVKYSMPVCVSFNRPVLNILDQVSGLQSRSSHTRICNRVHNLMDSHLHHLTTGLMDEQKARNKLNEFPKLILYDQLTDINLITEPFFRGMLQASVRATLRKLRQKLQIPIPSTMGRTMFGIMDESGQLQSGQVFIRYTRNAFNKLPKENTERIVLTGPVMLTKNPSIVAGDIRMYEAVDLPCLHYLSDVVVFPSYGTRPHPDEMAGSDLDGDEYTVIWDSELYLEGNEEAFDYTSQATESIPTTEEELRINMANFFVDYIKQDSIGKIANAFLINADLYGIKHEVCQRIAKKHMAAVDFPKTGVPPPELSKKWDGDKPPERSERSPDYMEKVNEPSYISSRLNGQLFRRAKQIDDIISATNIDGISSLKVDERVEFPGWDQGEFKQLAKENYDAYAANIQNLMDSYSIKTEGELFSGHYISMRNRISDKDSDDMSLYNTAHAIEQRLFTIFSKFRKQFFETHFLINDGQTHLTFEELTELERGTGHSSGNKEVFRRVCRDPNDNLMRLACAYYKHSYTSNTTKRFLSFAWLAWDVLKMIMRRSETNASGVPATTSFSFDPLSEKISDHINEYLKKRGPQLNEFRQKMLAPDRIENLLEMERKAWKVLQRYCQRHKGLDKLLYFCTRWANLCNLFNKGTINELHICLLLIRFGLNHFGTGGPAEMQQIWLERISPDSPDCEEPVDLECQLGGLGKKLMLFLEFLASRNFKILPYLSFMEPDLGYASVFYQSQWIPIHESAMITFHSIAFTLQLKSLPCTKKQEEMYSVDLPENVFEADPFLIEVPLQHSQVFSDHTYSQHLSRQLCVKTGCTHIVFRALPVSHGRETCRFYVSAKGSMDSISSLRFLASPRPRVSMGSNEKGFNCQEMTKLMALQVYEKLVGQ